MDNEIEPLYLETKVSKKISLEPYELNNDILYNIKNKLIKLEKKCYRFGYLHKVLNVLKYDDGIVPPEDLMCRTVYPVLFECLICDPQINKVIITKIRSIDDTLISSEVGPIHIITPPNRLTKNFKMKDSNLLYVEENGEETLLKKGDYIKVVILNKKFNEYDEIIKAIGNIIGIPTEDEIKKSLKVF